MKELSEPSKTLPILLNKVVAICRCGAGTQAELGRFLKRRPQQINEWLIQRTHEPSGSIAIQMQVWAASKTLAICALGSRMQIKYRTEYRLACDRFPVEQK